jgi:signal transduction histidine kinase
MSTAVTVHLPHHSKAAELARNWTLAVLAAEGPIDPGQQDLLEIMISELVTNVVEHTDSTPHLTARREAGRVVVAVADDDPLLPVVRAFDPARVGGHGLELVDAWSERWGVEPTAGHGKSVWFTLRAEPEHPRL